MRHNTVPVVKGEAVKGAHKSRPINCANIPSPCLAFERKELKKQQIK